MILSSPSLRLSATSSRDTHSRRRPHPLLRWLLNLALICGMLFTPMAMVNACTPKLSVETVIGNHVEHDPDQHATTKQVHCMGCWSIIEVGITAFPERMAPPRSAAPTPAIASLDGVLLERDTPPPRLS